MSFTSQVERVERQFPDLKGRGLQAYAVGVGVYVGLVSQALYTAAPGFPLPNETPLPIEGILELLYVLCRRIWTEIDEGGGMTRFDRFVNSLETRQRRRSAQDWLFDLGLWSGKVHEGVYEGGRQQVAGALLQLADASKEIWHELQPPAESGGGVVHAPS